MNRWRRASRLTGLGVCVGLLSAVAARAQSPVDSLTPYSVVSAEEVRALLDSSRPREKAWGAWFARRDSQSEMIPRIQTALGSGYALTQIALDALIQLNAKAPAKLLEPLPVYDFGPESLILLARLSPAEADPILIKMMANSEVWRDGTWYGASNLLLLHRSPGLAATLLGSLRINLTVTLCCGKMGPTRGRGVEGARIANRLPDGFPPIQKYHFTERGPGFTLLADGPRPVYYYRGGLADGGRYSLDDVSVDDRVAYLKALVPDMTIPFMGIEAHTVQMNFGDPYNSTVAAFREDIVRRYCELLRALELAGKLTQPESAQFATPVIDLELRDWRAP